MEGNDETVNEWSFTPYSKRWEQLQIGKSTLITTISSLLPRGLIHLSKMKQFGRCWFLVFFKLASLFWCKYRAGDDIKIRIF